MAAEDKAKSTAVSDIQVMAIRFNHKQLPGNYDAYSISEKDALKGRLPEWDCTNKKAYPALYLLDDLVSKKTTIMVAFKANMADLRSTNVKVKAKVSTNSIPKLLGDIDEININFKNGKSDGKGVCKPLDSYDRHYVETKLNVSNLAAYSLLYRRVKFKYNWSYSVPGKPWVQFDKTEHEIIIVTNEELFALKNDLARGVNYFGLDPKIAQTANDVIKKTLEDYPKLRRRLKFLGSYYGMNQEFFMRNLLEGRIPSDDDYEISKASTDYKECVGFAVANINSDNTSDDVCNVKYRGIFINDFDSKTHKQATYADYKKRAVKGAGKDFPKGANSVEYFIDHELGHILDFLLKISKDTAIMDKLTMIIKKTAINEDPDILKNNPGDGFLFAAISKVLSGYASEMSKVDLRIKGYPEWIADGWGEYRNCLREGTKCRPVAKHIADEIINAYKKLK